MFVKFDSLPETSRVWIYQAGQQFTDEQVKTLEEQLSAFCSSWETHGKPVKSSFEIAEKQFLIIAVDEDFNTASGCSIDKSVNLIKEIENRLAVSLLDRTQVAYLSEGELKQSPVLKLREKVQQGAIVPDTIIFNNSITKLGELRTDWKIKANTSWLSKYFNN